MASVFYRVREWLFDCGSESSEDEAALSALRSLDIEICEELNRLRAELRSLPDHDSGSVVDLRTPPRRSTPSRTSMKWSVRDPRPLWNKYVGTPANSVDAISSRSSR